MHGWVIRKFAVIPTYSKIGTLLPPLPLLPYISSPLWVGVGTFFWSVDESTSLSRPKKRASVDHVMQWDVGKREHGSGHEGGGRRTAE